MKRTKLAGIYNIIGGMYLFLISIVIIIFLFTNNITGGEGNDIGEAVALVFAVIFLLMYLGLQLVDAVLHLLFGVLTVRNPDSKRQGVYLKLSVVQGFVFAGIYIFFVILLFGFRLVFPAIVSIISILLSVAGIVLNIFANSAIKKSE